MTTNKPEVVAYSWQCHGRHSTVDKKFADELAVDGEGVDPLIRLSDYEALQAECEKLRKDAATERAIQRAAGVLPPGYRIEIEIEKDAGSVALFAPDASVECDFQGGIAEQIADAIDAALRGEQS